MGVVNGFVEVIVFLILIVALLPVIGELTGEANVAVTCAEGITGSAAITTLLGIVVLVIVVGFFLRLIKSIQSKDDGV